MKSLNLDPQVVCLIHQVAVMYVRIHLPCDYEIVGLA